MRCGSREGALALADRRAADRYSRYLWCSSRCGSPGRAATAVHHMSRLQGRGAGDELAWSSLRCCCCCLTKLTIGDDRPVAVSAPTGPAPPIAIPRSRCSKGGRSNAPASNGECMESDRCRDLAARDLRGAPGAAAPPPTQERAASKQANAMIARRAMCGDAMRGRCASAALGTTWATGCCARGAEEAYTCSCYRGGMITIL
jgi:hypothetical protein